MTATVPAQRPEPDEGQIRIGEAPSSVETWTPLLLLGNWLRGSGAQIVATNFPNVTVSSGTTRVIRYRTFTRATAIQRIWVLDLRTTATTLVTATVKAPHSTGTAVIYPVPSYVRARGSIIYTETVASPAAAEAQVSIEVTATGGDLTVVSVACYEQHRSALGKDTTDIGADLETVRRGQPIRYTKYESITGAYDLATGGADARRVSIFAWGVPEESAITRTLNTEADLFGLTVPVLGPLINNGQTTAVLKCSVYAKVAGGSGTDAVRFLADGSAAERKFTIANTSFAWATSASFAPDCDDMSASDGRRSSRFDGVQVKYKGDGTNQLSLAGACIWTESVS